MFYLRLISKPVLLCQSVFAGPILHNCIKSLGSFFFFFFLGLFLKFFQQYWYMHLKMSTLFTTKTSIKISLFRTSGFAKLNKLKETLHKQQLPFLLRIITVPQKLCVFLSTDSDEIFYYLVKFFQLKITSQSRHKHMFKSMGNNIQNPFAYENQNS